MADAIARGVRFHVQRLGDDAAGASRSLVVFVHGLVMDNLSSWYFTVANPVAQIADVLLYDLRGHGKSERTPDGYTLADHVEDLHALLATATPDRPAHLVGNSFGGLLALAFAVRHPDRVASLTLIDAHLGDEGFGEQMAGTLSLEGEARDRRIADSFKEWLGRHSERKRNRLATAASELVERTTLLSDMRSTPPLDPSELSRIDVPVLAIYGELSELRAKGEAALRSLRRGRIVVLAGCTHSVLWEATDRVRSLVVEFLGGVAGDGTATRSAP
jgi:pimeloyl-ACP methyl ester carboxylesterase